MGWSQQLVAIDGVEQVTPFRRAPVTLNGDPRPSRRRTSRRSSEIAGIEISEGSFDDLGPGGIVVSRRRWRSAERRRRGQARSTVTLTNSAGDTVDLEVVGIVDALDRHRAFTGNFVAAETFDSFIGETEPASAFVDVASGAQSDVEEQINEVLSLRPDISMTAGSAIGAADRLDLRLPDQRGQRAAADERHRGADRHRQHDVAVDPRTAP